MAINTFTLKMIAIVAMLIDHIGAVLFPQYIELRIIGRLAFPIFAYTLVEGFIYTHDVYKYMIRLGVLALLSEIPFDLAFFNTTLELSHQNVFFTLLLGVFLLHLLIKTPGKFRKAIWIIAFLLLSEYLHTDYSSMGLLMILVYYYFRENKVLKLMLIAAINVFLMGYIQVYAILAMIPIAFHNGKQGLKCKWFFYGFYPIHLLIIYFSNLFLYH